MFRRVRGHAPQAPRLRFPGSAERPPRALSGFPERQEIVGGEARYERPEGARSSHMNLSHPPERPPGGIFAKQRSGWALGQILRLAGKSMAFGAFQSPNHHLLSKQLESVIKQMRCLRQRVFAKMHF